MNDTSFRIHTLSQTIGETLKDLRETIKEYGPGTDLPTLDELDNLRTYFLRLRDSSLTL